MVQKLVGLALAGALGTLARYGLNEFVSKFTDISFLKGTLIVNLIGCFLAGLIWASAESRWPMASETRVFILVGFMGAFTTFSAFVLETGLLMRSADWTYAAINIFLQNCLGLLALLAGMALGRLA